MIKSKKYYHSNNKKLYNYKEMYKY